MNRKEFIVILVITFFVITVWIIADIIHAKPSVNVDPKINSLLDPINPTFDQTIIERVKQRKDNFP